MTDLFLRVVELSWQAGVLALAVMLGAAGAAPRAQVGGVHAVGAGGRCG